MGPVVQIGHVMAHHLLCLNRVRRFSYGDSMGQPGIQPKPRDQRLFLVFFRSFAFSLELETLIFVLFFSSPQLVFISDTLLDPVLTQSRYNVLDMIIVHDWRADLKGKMIVRLSD